MQKDIAREAGVSRTAVSLALRNDPSIAKATTQRILDIAGRLGYQRDPFLSALSRYHSITRPQVYSGTIAWIYDCSPSDVWPELNRKTNSFPSFREGAVKRAAILGFQVEEFWLREKGMTSRRLSDVLKARGIRGIILLPQTRNRARLKMEWDQFAMARIGDYSIVHPDIDLIAANHFQAVPTALRELRKLGYKRVGYVMSHRGSERTDHLFTSSFLFYQSHLFDSSNKVPPHLFRKLDLKMFDAWMKKNNPDVLLFGLIEEFYLIMDHLRSRKIKVPDHLGVALVCLPAQAAGLAGVEENWEKVGSMAIDLVARKLVENEMGLPVEPTRVLVQGIWRHGSTVRKGRSASFKNT